MSSKLLTELDPTHTLQDDMESLVYVVLYTALHHLPHNLNPDQLAQFIKDFFDASYQWGSQLLGGGAKQANIADRHMTKRVKFEDANFQRWLDTVLDMHMSMDEAVRDEEVTDMWTDTRHLDSFWRQFLVDVPLDSANRVDNELPERSIPSKVPTFTPVVSRHSAPKRAAEVSTTASNPRAQPIPSSKRRRVEPVAPLERRRSGRLGAKTVTQSSNAADVPPQRSNVAHNSRRSLRSNAIRPSKQRRRKLA